MPTNPEDLSKPQPKAPPAPKIEEREGHAIMSVDVPARTVEVSLAHSPIEGCALAAVGAWEKVRNVAGGDAAFADCGAEFRRELINAAEAIYRGGQPMTTDTTMAKFEREVAVIRGKQEEAKAKAAKASA
jgi:hypothetical protein